MGTRRGATELEPPPEEVLGENGFAREQVANIQRARMLTAMVEEVSERGAGNVSVAHVVARSGVSRRTFYEMFVDREDCFLAAFDEAMERVAEVVIPAYEVPGQWRSKVRSALMALLGCFDNDPRLGRLLVVESLAAGNRTSERRTQVLDKAIAVVEEGRGAAKRHENPPPLAAEGVIGGVLAILHGRLLVPSQAADNESAGLIELINPLMGMIVLPYLGLAAARKELDVPVPAQQARRPRPNGNPLREIQMRLTYRTVRVLLAVAANPGSSNRLVGEGAGIGDQGQISKLLTRLEGIGLIENVGAGTPRGGPNAWTLTDKGWEVHAAIAHQGHDR
jgi:AcrR family transcriptional regulator